MVALTPLSAGSAPEEVNTQSAPTRYGMALVGGNSYTPRNDISLFMVNGFALLDYEKVWHHKAPAPLRFKTEFALGSAAGSEHGFVGSAGIMAVYYLDHLSGRSLRPYVEGGIGLIYTEFRVEGQGLNLNFNPQAGIGVELPSGFFTAARLHHLSNAGLDRDNRGVNSVVLMIGRFLK
jgi:lipid A 3-O-deacylase